MRHRMSCHARISGWLLTGLITLYFMQFGFKSIQSLMDLRHEGDYQDFARITEEEAKGALDAATNLISVLKAALERLLEEI